MYKIIFPMLILISVSACIQQPGTTACMDDAYQCPDGSVVGRVPPTCEFAPCPVIGTNETPAPSQTLNFSIEADDNGYYMNGNKISNLDINGTNQVTITFSVRTTNVYYGGLDFRGWRFDTPDVLPGGQTTISFVSDTNFTITSFWPSSNVRKADLQILIT